MSTSRQLRSFVTAPYLGGDNGQLRPERPRTCPYTTDGTGPCEVVLKGFHARKTGPGHPLQIALCKKEGRFFTIQPPGYTPFGRRPLLNVDHHGHLVDVGRDTKDMPSCVDGTVFQAAFDMALGRFWPIFASDGEAKGIPLNGVRKTQTRQIDLACRFLGIAADQGDELRRAAAKIFCISETTLRDAAGRIRDGPRFKERAVEATTVFRKIRCPSLSVLLARGVQLEMWKPPLKSPFPE